MFRVINQPIDLQELVRFVTDPEAGAIAPPAPALDRIAGYRARC